LKTTLTAILLLFLVYGYARRKRLTHLVAEESTECTSATQQKPYSSTMPGSKKISCDYSYPNSIKKLFNNSVSLESIILYRFIILVL
jgi:hypothetical protein